jgi:CRP-like cAMP-binding protein
MVEYQDLILNFNPMDSQQDLHTITHILKQIPLLKELNEQDHQEIIKHIKMEYYPKGHRIFKEGDEATTMYIIKSGIVRIFHAGETASFDKEVAMLADNDFFGEMALISEQPRNANAQVVEDAQVFTLKKEDLIKLISENPNFAASVSGEFLKRFKSNMRQEKSDIQA